VAPMDGERASHQTRRSLLLAAEDAEISVMRGSPPIPFWLRNSSWGPQEWAIARCSDDVAGRLMRLCDAGRLTDHQTMVQRARPFQTHVR
jgi:hypothetical protein